jgi:cob(I)alamin adenosyltransferase
MKGFIHVYTGNGKGKTSAAMGLVLRAAGAGLSVFVSQFAKDGSSSEIRGLKRFSGQVEVAAFGTGLFLTSPPASAEISAARRGLDRVRNVLKAAAHDLVVMDEACVAVSLGLFSIEDLLSVVDAKALSTELVITGRNAPAQLIARADLVTEMREIKHYFRNGVAARRGIEQ